jgi:hypothetical protein
MLPNVTMAGPQVDLSRGDAARPFVEKQKADEAPLHP